LRLWLLLACLPGRRSTRVCEDSLRHRKGEMSADIQDAGSSNYATFGLRDLVAVLDGQVPSAALANGVAAIAEETILGLQVCVLLLGQVGKAVVTGRHNNVMPSKLACGSAQ